MDRRTFIRATTAAVSSAAAMSPLSAMTQTGITLSFDFVGLCVARLWQKNYKMMEMLLVDGAKAGLDAHAPLLIAKCADVYAMTDLEEPSVLTLGGIDFFAWSLWDRFVIVDGYDDASASSSLDFVADPCESAKSYPSDLTDPSEWADRHWAVHLHQICNQRTAPIKQFKYVAGTVRLTMGSAYCGMPALDAQRQRIYKFGDDDDPPPPYKQAFTNVLRGSLDIPSSTVSLKLWIKDRSSGTIYGGVQKPAVLTLKPAVSTYVNVSVSNISSNYQSSKSHFGAFYKLIDPYEKPHMCVYKDHTPGTTCTDVHPDAPSPFCIPPVAMQD